MSRASFSDEFKRDAVAQITTRGYSCGSAWKRDPVSGVIGVE
jgi:transposase-like protein